tara:strand:+ start:274 stop:564 length:291 start_codon:yes stop_codon:yes gene_type:complete
MKYNLVFPESFGEYLCGGLTRWVVNGIAPGHFLTAVLTNNLFEAVAHADDENIKILPDIVRWVYNHAPSSCWGTEEKMKEWKGIENMNVNTEIKNA